MTLPRRLAQVLLGIGIGLFVIADMVHDARMQKRQQVLQDVKESWVQQTDKKASDVRKKARRLHALYETADTPITGPDDPYAGHAPPDTYVVSSTPNSGATKATCSVLFEVLRTAPGPPVRLHCYREEARKGSNPVRGQYFIETRTIALYDVGPALGRPLMETLFHEVFHHFSQTGYTKNYASISVVAEELKARLYARKQFAEWKHYCFGQNNHSQPGCF